MREEEEGWVVEAGPGEEAAGERGKKKRRRTRRGRREGVRAMDACGQEERKEACVRNFICLRTRTVVKSKLFTWEGKNVYLLE